MSVDNLVIRGSLNFSIGAYEVWGPHARIDSLSNYFINLVRCNLIYVYLIKCKPSWRNNE